MKTMITAVMLCAAFLCRAQEKPFSQALSVELGGLSTSTASIQYDYFFKHSAKGFFDVRAGVGGLYINKDMWYTLPHAVTYNFGKQNRFFEAGIGGVYRTTSSESKDYFFGPTAGYTSRSASGFQFRIYAAYLVNSNDNRQGATLGFGVGKVFRKK